ncbi:MAG: FKBP-type peptidyl-prolyl cis-trans isomerase [Bacteroidetes bacterium]|jgi:FKBP-type peptidyl-prolyl cis-trans isomerase FkpA|nr:FKBP-type peptidyl-prolyl cis-trans isomerase [Bacteroidota bacterium]
MKLSFLSIFSFLLLFTACNSGESGSSGISPNGFEYEFHLDKEGAIAQPGEYAYFQATMRNGEEVTLDSRSNPVMPRVLIPSPSAPANGRPSAVVEALSLMSIGDSLTVFQAVEEGTTPPPGYNIGDKIAFDLVMMDIKTEAEYQGEIRQQQEAGNAAAKAIKDKVATIVADYSAGALDDQIQTTESGLKYLIFEEGTGAQAVAGKQVSVNYFGVLTNGNEFDNSYKRGRTFDFPLGAGQVIRGWDEGIALLKEGGSGVLFVPPSLGYGAADKGNIPPNSELIFHVALEKVN